MLARLILVLAGSACFFSCSHQDVAEQRARQLDSIAGAIGNLQSRLLAVDTVSLAKAVARHHYYLEFVQRNIHDTLNRMEADQLSRFMKAGETLREFTNQRYSLLSNAVQMLQQMKSLTADVRDKKISEKDLLIIYMSESSAAHLLLSAGNSSEQAYHAAMQDFRSALQPTEVLIRSRNHGELPEIIKDTLEF